MKRLPWLEITADAAITACCVIACVNALPTTYGADHITDLTVIASFLFSALLCVLIHRFKKAWPLPCLGFALLIALYGVLARRAVSSGANIVWYSAARLWSLDFSFVPTPAVPEAVEYPSGDVDSFLLLASAVFSLITSVLVIKPRSPIPALLVPIPAFAGCFVYTDCRPAVFTVALAAVYIVSVLFACELKKRDERLSGRARLLFLPALACCVLLITIISPQKRYDPIPFSERQSFFDVLGPWTDELFSRGNNNPTDVDLTMDGDREVDESKAFSVNCTRRGTYLLRTHSYGRYAGGMWKAAPLYLEDWSSLEQLGHTQTAPTAILRVRDAHMKDRLTPYAFLAREEVKVGETSVKSDGRSAYVWTFMPSLFFTPAESSAAEDKYYSFALEQYTLPDGPVRSKLLDIVDQMNEMPTEYYLHGGLWTNVYHIDVNDPYGTALQVAAYVRSHGEYTLTPGKTPAGRDFVDYFLNENQRGYCVHFASSTAALLQAIGIPARYVIGYRVVIDKPDTWVDVPRYAAHAWTEVYVKGVGWLPIESSAGYSSAIGYMRGYSWQPVPTETEPPKDTPRPDLATPVPDITPEPTARPTARPSSGPVQTDTPEVPGRIKPQKWLKPAAIILGIAAVWQLAGVFIRLRRRRLFRQKDPRAAVLAMLKYLEGLIRLGAGLPEDHVRIKLEAAFSNHDMTEQQAKLLNFVRYNRKTLQKHHPLMRFILKWVIFRL